MIADSVRREYDEWATAREIYIRAVASRIPNEVLDVPTLEIIHENAMTAARVFHEQVQE